MKTRTLLLLALGCGLAIMLAGAALLFQLSTQDDVAPAIEIGDTVEVADMRVTVETTTESAESLEVTVRIVGVDEPDGADGFRLIASGRPVSPTLGGDRCVSSTNVENACTLRFDVSAADGSSRVLFYERGDERARWVLA